MPSKPLPDLATGTRQEGPAALLPLLACPACAAGLVAGARGLRCEGCGCRYPLVGHPDAPVPWLADPIANVRAEWHARHAGFLAANAHERERLSTAIAADGTSRLARARLKTLLDGRRAQAKQVSTLLAPYLGGPSRLPPALCAHKVPRHQGVLSYYDNVFRDWAWNTGEREALLDALTGVLPADSHAERVLTLGAGAGYFPAALHELLAPELSLALDLNPLLVAVGSAMCRGETLTLTEFPLSPRDASSGAVSQGLAAPGAVNVCWLLADALRAPLRDASFDLVVTPWLIDILPEDLRTFLPRLNRLLPPGGMWLNSGTLSFFHEHAGWCYSEGELMELIRESGFKLHESSWRTVSYLHSPWSHHGRREGVLSFCAEKVEEVAVPAPFELLPDYLLDPGKPVASTPRLERLATEHLFKAQVLTTIDGTRCLNDIGAAVAAHYDLPLTESVLAAQRLLAELTEEGQRGDRWLKAR